MEKKEFGSKLSSLYISQVKRKGEIEVEENYNLPKSGNERVLQCPKEKEDVNKHQSEMVGAFLMLGEIRAIFIKILTFSTAGLLYYVENGGENK